MAVTPIDPPYPKIPCCTETSQLVVTKTAIFCYSLCTISNHATSVLNPFSFLASASYQQNKNDADDDDDDDELSRMICGRLLPVSEANEHNPRLYGSSRSLSVTVRPMTEKRRHTASTVATY